MDMVQLPLSRESPLFFYGQVVTSLVAVWQSGAWIMPIIINYLMTRTLTERFEKLNKEIERSVVEGNKSRLAPGMEDCSG